MSAFPESVRIHPSAVVEEGAVLGEGVVVGAFSYVGPQVVLKAGTHLLNHVSVSGRTTIGEKTAIYPMAVIGGPPQAIRHDGSETTLEVGSYCTIREGVTMNTGSSDGGGKTVVGDRNLFLANSHVAHDCVLGNGIILSNNVMLAGHVRVDDHAILGGGAAVHQFSRIGRHAFVGGMSGVPNDVIPYGMLHGNPGHLDGLNIVGMTRSGISRETIHRVRRAYKQIFEAEGSIRTNAIAIREEYADCPEVMEILDFIGTESDRALCAPAKGKR